LTKVHEIMGLDLALEVFPQLVPFEGDAVLRFIEPGLYSKKR